MRLIAVGVSIFAAAIGSVAAAAVCVPRLPVTPRVGTPTTVFVARVRVPETIHTWDDFSDELSGPGGRDGCAGRLHITGSPSPFYRRRGTIMRVPYPPAHVQEHWGRVTWCPGRFRGVLAVYYLRRGRPGCVPETHLDRCYRKRVLGTFTFTVRRG